MNCIWVCEHMWTRQTRSSLGSNACWRAVPCWVQRRPRDKRFTPLQEERVEQLRSFTFLSGVLAGFSVASLLQLSFNVAATDHGIQLWFAISNAIAVSVQPPLQTHPCFILHSFVCRRPHCIAGRVRNQQHGHGEPGPHEHHQDGFGPGLRGGGVPLPGKLPQLCSHASFHAKRPLACNVICKLAVGYLARRALGIASSWRVTPAVNCRYKPGNRPPGPRRTFRNHWDTRCEGEWKRAFYLFSLGKPSWPVWDNMYKSNCSRSMSTSCSLQIYRSACSACNVCGDHAIGGLDQVQPLQQRQHCFQCHHGPGTGVPRPSSQPLGPLPHRLVPLQARQHGHGEPLYCVVGRTEPSLAGVNFPLPRCWGTKGCYLLSTLHVLLRMLLLLTNTVPTGCSRRSATSRPAVRLAPATSAAYVWNGKEQARRCFQAQGFQPSHREAPAYELSKGGCGSE